MGLVRKVVAGCWVCAVALASCGSSTTTVTRTQAVARAAAGAATQVRIFTPVSGDGSATIHISSRPRGYCWTTSNVIRHADAWRCFVGNFIHDPCYSGSGATENTVICPEGGPWVGSGIEIRLTRPLPEAPPTTSQPEPPSGLPWALQLADGSNCQFLQGATSVVAGLRFNYSCTPDHLSLYGEPRRSSAAWTIYSGAASSSQLTTAPIAIAWY
jgi:hypothetical protein